jgi:hypothetical protein
MFAAVPERSIERGPCPGCGCGRVEITVDRQKHAGRMSVARSVISVDGCRTKTCRWYQLSD